MVARSHAVFSGLNLEEQTPTAVGLFPARSAKRSAWEHLRRADKLVPQRLDTATQIGEIGSVGHAAFALQ